MPFTATILCVDDDEDDLFFIREVIDAQPHAFHIEQARNGQEAMDYLNESLSTGVLPCLVIMDINMPRMDGKQAIKKIREQDALAKMPIVVFTTSSNVTDKNYFESQGIHFVTKPFDYK